MSTASTTAQSTLKAEELARYSRHIVLPEVGREGQERLSRSKVLIVGAGGLGSPAALYLAAAGVGELGLVDFDRVEEHNLQRQILHGTAEIGTPKVESARRRLSDLNPHVLVRPHGEGVSTENSTALFSQYDLIVDGSDNFPTRYLNNDSAFFAAKPLVYGSIFRFEGQVSVFHPSHGSPCYRCLFPTPPEPGRIPNCAEAGVFGALPGVIGSMQAMEAIKFLLGIGKPLLGRLLVFDALGMTSRVINLKKDPSCPLCGEDPRITDIRPERYDFTCSAEEAAGETTSDAPALPLELSVEEARERLGQASENFFVLDVREPYETEICRLPGAIPIPMRQISAQTTALPGDKPILVYCHHGMRSLHVVKFLRDRGFPQACNLQGGIDAWARKCDPEMPRY